MLRSQLNDWLDKEEIMWDQRSKQLWLINGDRNTKYFHTLARTRKINNSVVRIKKQDGTWLEDYEEIEHAAEEFFLNIYLLSPNPQDDRIVKLKQVNLPLLSNDVACNLSQMIQKGEIKNAFFQMSPYKSPGIDGLPAGFYHHFWSLVEDDITKMIQQFFGSAFLLKQLNHTLITLIPKTGCPTTFKEFRPISLCNVVYKAITKILVLRLQHAMKDLIAPHQNAFIKGRLISDSIFITAEMMDFIHRAKHKKTFWCAIKIDFFKAYDRIRWDFLESTLLKMNFPQHIVNIIMQCVRTVQYSLLLNGHKVCTFQPQRGLRQGDPLSPYLFICCMNVLSAMLHQAEENNHIQGIQFNRSGPRISHVMYADDLVLFFKAVYDSCRFLAALLQSFCNSSGLHVNRDKSFAFFSPNTLEDLRNEMANMFNLTWASRLGKYLGTFVDDHKDRNRNFKILVDKMNSRLAGWKSKILSQAGRLTLIHSTLCSDIIYPMSTIQFTKQQNREINKIVTSFFWGDNTQKRTPHLLQARLLRLPRRLGGVGIKDAQIVKRTMLAKSSWRIIHNRNTSISQWSAHKYFKDTIQWLPKRCSQTSFCWKSIVSNLPIITNNLRWQVENGTDIDLSSRFWLAPLPDVNGITVAEGLLHEDGVNWDVGKISNLYPSDMVITIQSILLSKLGNRDKLVWTQSLDGIYNCKDGYKLLTHSDWQMVHPRIRLAEFPWKDFWRVKVPHRILLFIWRLLLNAIPLLDILQKHHIQVNNVCPFCDSNTEDRDHVFLWCSFAQAIWFGIKPALRPTPSRFYDLDCWMNFWANR